MHNEQYKTGNRYQHLHPKDYAIVDFRITNLDGADEVSDTHRSAKSMTVFFTRGDVAIRSDNY